MSRWICLSLSWGLSLLLWKGLEFSLQAWSDGSWICPLLSILCWHLGKDAFKVRALWFAVWEEELLPVTLECSGWLVGDCLQTTCFSGKFRQQLRAGHSQSFMPATHSSPTEGDQSRPQTEAVCGSSDFLQENHLGTLLLLLVPLFFLRLSWGGSRSKKHHQQLWLSYPSVNYSWVREMNNFDNMPQAPCNVPSGWLGEHHVW